MTGAQPRRSRSGRRFPRAEPALNKPADDAMPSVMAKFVARGLREVDRIWRSRPDADRLPMIAGSRAYADRRDRSYSALLARHLTADMGGEDESDCSSAPSVRSN
jgi:hypothetical protein